MKIELFTCGVLLLALKAPGSDAQLSVCGTAPLNTKKENRIVGGQQAAAGAWPWQASLQIRGALCGGSLINNQWVLSAAHCFSSTSTSNVQIYLGRLNLQSTNTNQVVLSASQIIVHPSYNSNTNNNDLALVKLSSTVTFTDYIRPVCLAADGSVFPGGLDSWVTGFGTTSSGGTVSNTLQEVDVPIVTNSDCNNSYGSITSNMLCAGLTQGGKDSCQGDSGGPLVCINGTTWVQAGVVSFGNGCAQAKYPGVYARVSQYQAWISSQVTGDQPGFVNFQNSSNTTVTTGTTGTNGAAHVISLSVPLLLSIPPVVFTMFVLS
ncbi:trypsin-2 [Nematolebias whitei]|uniref:trypsin-2 n=1 Tax=Nematolebias whitei TaxID=451745 RepID=UPI00189B5513|nr:trypsin-2 [Nematolebias whitei]